MIATKTISKYENTSAITQREQGGAFAASSVKGKAVPYRFFFIVDLCLVWASAGIAYLLKISCTQGAMNPLHSEFIGTMPLDLLLFFSVFVALFTHTQGQYELPSKRSHRDDLKLLTETVICSAIIVGSGAFIGGGHIQGVGSLLLTLILSWILLALWRKVVRAQSIPGLTEKRNVLIVGFGRTAHELARQLEQNPTLGYVVKGFVSRRRTPRSIDRGGNEAESALLGTVDEISSIARSHFIDEILICVPSDRNLVMEITQKAQAASVQVRVIPDLYDGLATGQPIEYVGQFPTLTLCQTTAPTFSLMIKRLVDIAF